MSETELLSAPMAMIPDDGPDHKHGKVFSSLMNVMRDIGAIVKDAKNQQQGFNYRSVDAVYGKLQPLLIEHGVFFTTRLLGMERDQFTTSRGSVMFSTRVACRFRFFSAEDGSYVDSVVPGEGMDSGDKSGPKSLSIALKYAIFQLLCVPTEETAVYPDRDSHDLDGARKRGKKSPAKSPDSVPPPPSKPAVDLPPDVIEKKAAEALRSAAMLPTLKSLKDMYMERYAQGKIGAEAVGRLDAAFEAKRKELEAKGR